MDKMIDKFSLHKGLAIPYHPISLALQTGPLPRPMGVVTHLTAFLDITDKQADDGRQLWI